MEKKKVLVVKEPKKDVKVMASKYLLCCGKNF
jgi:hypothetical protein